MTFLIAVPTGVKFFNWVGTMWKGHITWETPMIFALGFMATFLFGGMTGIMLASRRWTSSWRTATPHRALPLHRLRHRGLRDVRRIYFWFPKATGRMLDERLGKIHFWLTFLGFHGTFFIQHWLGNMGMPRRYADYLTPTGSPCSTRSPPSPPSSSAPRCCPSSERTEIVAFGEIVTVDDPWGYGNPWSGRPVPAAAPQLRLLPRIRSSARLRAALPVHGRDGCVVKHTPAPTTNAQRPPSPRPRPRSVRTPP